MHLNRSDTSDEIAAFVPSILIDGESLVDKETQS